MPKEYLIYSVCSKRRKVNVNGQQATGNKFWMALCWFKPLLVNNEILLLCFFFFNNLICLGCVCFVYNNASYSLMINHHFTNPFGYQNFLTTAISSPDVNLLLGGMFDEEIKIVNSTNFQDSICVKRKAKK